MKGLIINTYEGQLNCQDLISFLNQPEYIFNVSLWDITTYNEGESYPEDIEFTSDMAKKFIFEDKNVIIIALSLFVSKQKEYSMEIETYEDFLRSEYIVSIHILDCYKFAIFSKDESILQRIKENFIKKDLENKTLKEIDFIPLDTEMSAYALSSETCLWYL